MSYSDTENEHHEAISGGIVALRNEVAKLTASAHNMRGQGLACDDPDRARALYESSAAYADAAYRVGAIVNDFEQAESYRAGAMEAIGPVPTYDALEQQALSAERAAKSSRERAEFLENLISGLDADLGGGPRATTEDVLQAAARVARDARRFEGIRNAAVNLLDKVGGQYSAHTLVDLLTILLDGEHQETLAKFKAQVVKPEPLLRLPKISPELGEQIRRMAGNLSAVRVPLKFEPSVGEVVSGHDTTDVDGERTVGKITYVDADFVTVELARHRESLGWYLGYASLDRAELRPADAQEINAWERNLQLLQQENPAALKDSALLLEPGHLAADVEPEEPGKQLAPWVPEPGQIVTVLAFPEGERVTAQYVGPYGPGDPLAAVVQVPEEAVASEGHVWAKRKVDASELSPATQDEINAFTSELEAKGLDTVIR